ncbi:MAG: HPr kinase/phosphorylase [Rickettsiales bacterium]
METSLRWRDTIIKAYMTAPSLHASAFAYQGMGCLVMGESGSGKSRLVAECILYGARLIADDRVQLRAADSTLIASAVPQLRSVLELRGLGLIQRQDVVDNHPIHLAITLLGGEGERLQEPALKPIEGIMLPHLRLPAALLTNAGALLLYLEAMHHGRILPPDWRPTA